MRNEFAKVLTNISKKNHKLILLSGDIGNRLFNEFTKKANLFFYAFHIAMVNTGITTTPTIAITNAGIILFTFLY